MHAKLTDQLRERAALYALGALAPDEHREFERHLDGGCPACRAEVESLGTVAGNLALAAEPMAPRPEVRARLLAEIRSTPAAPEPYPVVGMRSTPPGPEPYPVVFEDEGDWVEIA